MKSKALFLLLILVTALALTILFMNRKGSFGKRNTSFSVDSGTEITAISLNGDDRVINLLKTREGWTVNDAGEARRSAVNLLLQTLTEISIKSPVTDEQFDREIVNKNISPVRVKVWSGRRQVSTFLVYKTDINPYGNIMKRRPGSRPFILSIPGFDGDIGSNFNMNEQFWLPFTIFNLYPSEIESVEVKYPGNDNDSFTVCNPSFTPVMSAGRSCLTDYDTVMVRRYLSYFTRVLFESWAFELDSGKSDSILNSRPLAIVAVHLADEVKSLRIWERVIETPEGLSVDRDRVWGASGDSQNIFIVRYYDIDPLLRRRSYFFR